MIVYRPQTFIAYDVHLGTFETVQGCPQYYEVEVPFWYQDGEVFYDENKRTFETYREIHHSSH